MLQKLYFSCLAALVLFLPPIAESKEKSKEPIDTARVMAEQERLVVLSSMVPKNFLTAKTGDAVTDNIFSSYTVPQIQVMLSEYEKKTRAQQGPKTTYHGYRLGNWGAISQDISRQQGN